MKGYVYDSGFLVFGNGMVRLDDVECVKVEPNDRGMPIAFVWFDGNESGPHDEEGHDYDFQPMSPEQEASYRTMTMDCIVRDQSQVSAFDPNYREPIPAEASTGSEPEPKPYTVRQFIEDVQRSPGTDDKPRFLIDTKEIDSLRRVYRLHLSRRSSGAWPTGVPSVDDEMRKLCRYSCLDWEQLKSYFDQETRSA